MVCRGALGMRAGEEPAEDGCEEGWISRGNGLFGTFPLCERAEKHPWGRNSRVCQGRVGGTGVGGSGQAPAGRSRAGRMLS